MKDKLVAAAIAVLAGLLTAGIVGLVALYGQGERHEVQLLQLQSDVSVIRGSLHGHVGASTVLPGAMPGPVVEGQ